MAATVFSDRSEKSALLSISACATAQVITVSSVNSQCGVSSSKSLPR